MSLFGKFFRNRNAKAIIKDIQDFKSTIDYETELDAVSFSAIDRIATSFASLSLGVYDKKNHQKVNHSICEVFDEPNLDETHSLFFYQLAKDYYAGNVFLYKYTDSNGEVTNLFRLNPSAVSVTRNDFNQKVFNYYGKSYTSEKILHIPSRFGYDGKRGHGIYQECKKIFETSTNLDAYTNNSFDNSVGKRLIIDITNAYPDATEEEQLKLRQKYINAYGGVKNSGKPIVKTGKVDFQTIDTGTSDNKSNQLLENRQYQEKVISEMFGIPMEYLSGNGSFDLENVTTLFITNAIQPLCQVFEESFSKLLNPIDRERYFIEFNYNSLLKTSLSSKIDAYAKQFNNGILTINQIKAKENLPPIESGDFTFVPANLMPLTKENVNAYMAKSKQALAEMNQVEKNEVAETVDSVGSDKS